VCSSLTADVIAFGSQLTLVRLRPLLYAHSYYGHCRLKEFVDNTGQLNILDNYTQLRERSKAIGYEVSKVVYRGFQCNDKLQVIIVVWSSQYVCVSVTASVEYRNGATYCTENTGMLH